MKGRVGRKLQLQNCSAKHKGYLGQGAGWVAWELGLAGADADRIGAVALDGRASTYVAPPPVSLQRWRGGDVG